MKERPPCRAPIARCPPGADPVQQLASDLRKLRDQAGSPTYQALARKTQAGPSPRSSTTLSDAAGGLTCPSWDTLVAYVTACGGRPGEWRNRWQQAQLWRQTSPAPTTSLDPAADHPPQPVDQVLDHQQSPGRESADCDGDPAADRQAVDPPLPRLTDPIRSPLVRADQSAATGLVASTEGHCRCCRIHYRRSTGRRSSHGVFRADRDFWHSDLR